VGFSCQFGWDDSCIRSCRLHDHLLGRLYGRKGSREGIQERGDGSEASILSFVDSHPSDIIIREQDFLNYVSLHDYKRAIELALAMSQPGRLFKLFKDVANESESEADISFTGNKSVDEVLRTLGGVDLAKLLRYIRDWNTSAKTSFVAQRVLHAIFKLRPAEEIMEAFNDETAEKTFSEAGENPPQNSGSTALKELVDAVIPYSERHLARLEKLVQDSYMIDYILGEMDGGIFDPELLDDDFMDIDAAPVRA